VNLAAVMQEVADKLGTVPGLRPFAYPPDTVTPPAAIVTYPGSYQFDETFGRGMDRIPDLPVLVLVGKVSDRASRDEIGAYCDGSGAKSVKSKLEVGPYTAFDTLRVAQVEFDVVGIGAVDYLAATFTLDIAGTGA
jgi:hypothetical protein